MNLVNLRQMALVSASTMATNWGELLDRTGQDTTSSDLDSFLAGPDEPPSLSITQVDSALGSIHSHHEQESEDNDFGVYVALGKSSRWCQVDAPLITGEDEPDEQDVSKVVSVDLNLRKSDRERKVKRSYSPDPRGEIASKRGRRIKRIPQKVPSVPAGDRLANGSPFFCDICRSPYVCSMAKRKKTGKPSKYRPAPRHKVDPVSGHTLTLCNACGLAFDRKSKPAKQKPEPSLQDKDLYLEEARTFALSLVESLNDPEAERLSCPYFKLKGCGCLQAYIVGDGNVDVSRKRASDLLHILKEAKRLSHQKWYDLRQVTAKNKKSRPIGLGNGQKRSKEFEQFVLTNRQVLRDQLKLCERATQRVLMYSNNFLHKKLKTESRPCRVVRVKGKSALGQLIPVEKLINENCCEDNCVTMALTHSCLLRQWRDRVSSGQLEARRVLGEMLTPSGGQRCNCYRFISWVTGCSFSTISKVNDQMRRSGGDRDPPVHGMCKYWQKKPKKSTDQKQSEQEKENGENGSDQDTEELILDSSATPGDIDQQNAVSEDTAATIVLQQLPQPEGAASVTDLPTIVTNATVTNIPFDMQTPDQKIVMLRQQLDQQERQLQTQQQLLNQQLLHQLLLDQATGGTSVQTQTLQNLQQLLNLQVQYQQQHQHQINSLQAVVATDNLAGTTHGQVIHIENLEQLQQLQANQICLQQQAQPAVLIQPGVLQELSQDVVQQEVPADKALEKQLLVTASDLGTSQLKFDKVTTATSQPQITVSTSGSQSLLLPSTQTVGNISKGGGSTLTSPVVHQILDLPQVGISLGGQLNSVNLGMHPTNLLSQLSEYTITPNLNITLVQPQGSTAATAATAFATENGNTELLTEQALGQLLGSLNYTVLAFEPQTGLDASVCDSTVPEETVATVTAQTVDLLANATDNVDPDGGGSVGVGVGQEEGDGTVETIAAGSEVDGDSVVAVGDQELSTINVLQFLGHHDISGHKPS